MATLSASSSLRLFTSLPSSNLPTPSLSLPQRLSLSSSSTISPSSFSLFISPSAYNSTYHVTRSNYISSFTIKASSSAEKKKVLIVNTNSGGHAVVGFYFAKELLGSSNQVTILTVGEESSDKMNKPPFTRFSEIVSAGGKTVWGDPSEIGKVLQGSAFDVVLDNNGKDLDTVRFVAFSIDLEFLNSLGLIDCDAMLFSHLGM